MSDEIPTEPTTRDRQMYELPKFRYPPIASCLGLFVLGFGMMVFIPKGETMPVIGFINMLGGILLGLGMKR